MGLAHAKLKPWVGLFDSFATRTFGGNVAGVVLTDEPLTERTMALIARELAVSTTGFVTVDQGVREGTATVRFFTPQEEIEACGHVTLALVQALLLHRVWSVDGTEHRVLAAGGNFPIGIEVASDRTVIEMRQRLQFIRDASVSKREVSDKLGLELSDELPLRVASTGLRHLIVPAASVGELGKMRLDRQSILELARRAEVDTIAVLAVTEIAFTLVQIRMRDLCAAIGDVEEAASGTTSGAIAAYLSGLMPELKELPSTVRIVMGVEMDRPSRIEVVIENGGLGELLLRVRGTAQLILEGTLILDAEMH
jgi:trans-2,3-dihydro-3-hydroxyanthranilate isomerase